MSDIKDRRLQGTQRDSDYYLGLTQPEGFTTRLEPQENLLLLVTAAGIGRGNEELGQLLMKKFFRALSEQGGLGKVFIFSTAGFTLPVQVPVFWSTSVNWRKMVPKSFLALRAWSTTSFGNCCASVKFSMFTGF